MLFPLSFTFSACHTVSMITSSDKGHSERIEQEKISVSALTFIGLSLAGLYFKTQFTSQKLFAFQVLPHIISFSHCMTLSFLGGHDLQLKSTHCCSRSDIFETSNSNPRASGEFVQTTAVTDCCQSWPLPLLAMDGQEEGFGGSD